MEGAEPGTWPGPTPSEKRAGLQRRLQGAGRVMAAVAAMVTAWTAWVARGRGQGRRVWLWLLSALALAAASAALWAGSGIVGVAVARLDCFLMRNETVTQQPVRLPGVTTLLLSEAEDFLHR